MINECRKKNIKTIICTGRNSGSIQQDVLDLNMDGVIYSGGCCIKFQDRVIEKIVIPKEVVGKILNETIFGIAVETEKNVYMGKNAVTIYEKLFLEKTKGLDEDERKKIKEENKFLYENNMKEFYPEKEAAYKLCLIDHKERLQQLKKELRKVCNVVQFIPFADRWLLECVPCGCDKGKAVRNLNKNLGITTKESMAFGDGENDIKLLEAVGIGIAMENSSKKLLEVADAVCDSVIENGVYKELVKRKLIKEKK